MKFVNPALEIRCGAAHGEPSSDLKCAQKTLREGSGRKAQCDGCKEYAEWGSLKMCACRRALYCGVPCRQYISDDDV